MNNKLTALSAVKPTGQITLGNYLGAIKPFIKYQDETNLIVFIADLHALTLPISPENLRKNTLDLLKIYLAAGLDPEKTLIFRQSDVSAHTQLEWILTCNTVLGEFTKMPQYKNFVEKNQNKAVPTGMLLYPSLMNADILLYDVDIVPVGIDQMSHIDLCRDVAEKFNNKYGETFKLPKGVIQESGAKIMSLTDPTKKMSKSESDKGTIYLLDDIEVSKKKIMKAITDSEGKVKYDPQNKPGVSNLMVIYSCLSGLALQDIETKYLDIENYGVFKRDLCELLEKELLELQDKIKRLENNLDSILLNGKNVATDLANKKIENVFKKIGLR